MGILYGMVARDHVVMAEFSSTKTTASAVARQILEKTKQEISDRTVSYSYDRYIFHIKRMNGLTALCMTDDSFGRRIPSAFLEDIHKRFVETYGRTILSAPAYAMNDEFSRVLSQLMDRYSNDPSADRVNCSKTEMNQVRVVVIENIEKVLDRGDCLALLVEKTTTLQGNAFQFRKQSHKYKNAVWWRNVKIKGALLFVLSILLYIVLAFVCHSPLMLSCLKTNAALL